nr:immunoglobulin heavy chain junction region [Macaca mulatta]MOW78584.1 immunoglobulin heavy chain junction region [Macaca mulatta]MOW80086.1 immunoglobulin heavy chain junction region [Macaca mulatta]MOW80361.1 immunoglobulin heavy chain junction region [Macaca mulatta]MOW82451.1 immunoglobulin heavy chain junction region [Macaca mulatta]
CSTGATRNVIVW